jgi:hypothetical protein
MSSPGTEPEEFRASWAQTWHTHIKPFLISNILIALVAWVIGYALGGPIVSVILPIVLVGGLVMLQRVWSRGHGLRLSHNGVEFLRRDGKVVRIRWADIERVTLLAQKQTGVIAPYGPARAAAASDAAAFAEANSGAGITGMGDVLTYDQAAQQQRRGPDWVRFGEPIQVNMRLVVVDRTWQSDRVGEWFRSYRPDLMPPL